MQCFHYVDFIRRANSPSASLPTRLLRVCLEGLETSLLMWVDAGVELETPWEEECVCVCVFIKMHVLGEGPGATVLRYFFSLISSLLIGI